MHVPIESIDMEGEKEMDLHGWENKNDRRRQQKYSLINGLYVTKMVIENAFTVQLVIAITIDSTG